LPGCSGGRGGKGGREKGEGKVDVSVSDYSERWRKDRARRFGLNEFIKRYMLCMGERGGGGRWDVPVLNGSFLREAVLYSWKGMSLVISLRDWAILSAAVVTEVAAARKEASLRVYVNV